MTISCLLILFSVSSETDSLVKRAEYLYENRHLSANYQEASRKILEDVLRNDPKNEKALFCLSKYYFHSGLKEKNKREKILTFEQGKILAESILKLNPKNPWGHFMFAANYGKICQAIGIFKTISAISKVKSEFYKVIELDSQNSDAYYALAAIDYQLPAILGGNKNRSIIYLKKAIELNPNFSLPYVELAEIYISQKRFKEADELLDRVLAIKNPAYPADYFLDDRPKALKLKEAIK